MLDTLFISWNVSPNLYDGFITLRYYSLLFGISFFLGHFIMKKMLLAENCPEKWLDQMLVYTVVATVIGARLGHVFFYDWDYYSQNLIEIPMVWKGGLASHGAAIAIVVAIWFFSKKVTKKSVFWSLDKIVVTIAIAACFIRIGNLMNSEIIGSKSESNYAFFFEHDAVKSVANFFGVTTDDVEINNSDDFIELDGFNYPLAELSIAYNVSDSLRLNAYYQNFASYTQANYSSSDKHYFTVTSNSNYPILEGNRIVTQIGIIPRIPTQLLEAFSYLLIFFLLFWGYWVGSWHKYEGFLFGLFLFLLFGVRFFIEFYKEHQTLADNQELNMGQWLSIPAALIGLIFIVFSLKKKPNLKP